MHRNLPVFSHEIREFWRISEKFAIITFAHFVEDPTATIVERGKGMFPGGVVYHLFCFTNNNNNNNNNNNDNNNPFI